MEGVIKKKTEYINEKKRKMVKKGISEIDRK